MTDKGPMTAQLAEIAVQSDGLDATIVVNGVEMQNVTHYTIEHGVGELSKLTLTMFADVKVTGPAEVEAGA